MSDVIKPVINSTVSATMLEPAAARLAANKSVEQKQKEKVCEGFEAYFVFQMLQGLEKTTLSNKGYMEETYMSVLYEKVADFIAQKGIGIKEMLMKYADRGGAKVSEVNGDNSGK